MRGIMLGRSLEMFSWEHLTAVFVTLLIIFLVWVFRNFFRTNKIADRILRYTIAFLLVSSETIVRFKSMHGNNPLVIRDIPLPLCGMLLWICAIGLIADSERIMRRFYPLFMVGASLSMIMCSIDGANFPDFRAFQYFICHGGFMLGGLYFIFTKRINKFNLADYGYSCVILLSMGAIMSFLYATNRNVFPDDFYVMGTGLPELKPVFDACGQVGFSLLYIISIAIFMGIFSGLAYLGTKHRANKLEVEAKYNASLEWIAKHSTKNMRISILVFTCLTTLYMMAWQAVMANMGLDGRIDPNFVHDPTIIAMGYIIAFLWFLIFTIAIINEMVFYYDKNRKAIV